MTRAAQIAALRIEHADALSSPLMSEGSISPAQVHAMSPRQREDYDEKRMRRMRVEAEIRDLSRTGEQIEADERATKRRDAADAEQRVRAMRNEIDMFRRIGTSKTTGKMRPKWQRQIDMVQAQIDSVLASFPVSEQRG